MKLPRVTGDKVQKALLRAGFSHVHTKGSHYFLYHEEKNCLVTVPVHSGAVLAPKTLKSILSPAQITVDELIAVQKSHQNNPAGKRQARSLSYPCTHS